MFDMYTASDKKNKCVRDDTMKGAARRSLNCTIGKQKKYVLWRPADLRPGPAAVDRR